MRRTKIVATVGPATADRRVLRQLVDAGVNVLRINFSHGELATHGDEIALARLVAEESGRVVAVLQDLQGPKIRIGTLAKPAVELREGRRIRLTNQTISGTANAVTVSYSRLAKDVTPGDSILLDDGALELRVEAIAGDDVECVVVRGGTLRPRKGVNLPGVAVRAPALTEKDRTDLRFGLAQGVDMVALSFVRHPKDADAARRVMSQSGRNVPLLAKIERPEALDHLDGILRAFDGVMVARGDLGVELSPEKVPTAQKEIIARANRLGKPVITATQMLESMTHSPQPTRAEASDVANAVLDGTDAVMLSGETAVGEFPVQTVQAMDRIVREAETIAVADQPIVEGRTTQSHAVCHAAATLAREVGAGAIAAFTRSGRTAQILSKLRPAIPIIALCERPATANQLALWRGIMPLVVKSARGDDLVESVARELRAQGVMQEGGIVVVVGAAPGGPAGRTNFIRLLHLSRVDEP
ncbi:MAG: pyruvate kinase [Chloroflexi bacterium]|nr:pyruvate kinase [Chloroflexota bacterium]